MCSQRERIHIWARAEKANSQGLFQQVRKQNQKANAHSRVEGGPGAEVTERAASNY